MKQIFLFIATMAACTCFAQDAKLITKAELNTVTVYATGAEMYHSASAILKKGANEIIITNISNNIDVNSIQVKAPGTATVLSVEFTNKYQIPTEKSAKVKQLEDSLAILQNQISAIDISIQNNKNLQKILDDNQTLKSPQNNLNIADLMKLVDYYKAKSTEVQNDILKLSEKRTKVVETTTFLKNRIQETQRVEAISGGRLILKVSSLLAGNADFSFTYITPNANWIPAYDVRVNSVNDPVQLVFKAKVSQTTGIDWQQVKLNLSTSTPSQFGVAPVLGQWFLTYFQISPIADERLNSIQHYELATEKSVVQATFDDNVKEPFNTTQVIYVVNGQALSPESYYEIPQSLVKSSYFMDAQSAQKTYGEIAAGGAYIITLKTDIEDYVNIAENTMNMQFEIDLPYDIQSNGQSQTIQVQTKEVPALYKHYCVPKLDPEVFLLAEIPNWNTLSLLSGEANIIFENTYVGKTFINPSSIADTFNLTIGKDKRISVKRQKIEDFNSISKLGSNKTQKFTYEITVKNNKKESVNFMLKDQFPLSTMKEVDVQLLEIGEAKVNKEIGVLSWQMNLAAGESKKVRFVYIVKYPKDKELNLE